MKFEHANLVVATRYPREGYPEVLVGEKLRGPFAGNIVFPGGKVDDGERRRPAAAREFREETGIRIRPGSLRMAGRIVLYGDRLGFVDIFHTEIRRGEPKTTDEFSPEWRTAQDNSFYDGMPEDVPYWFTEVFTTQSFRAHAVWDAGAISRLTITGHTPGSAELYDYRREYEFADYPQS